MKYLFLRVLPLFLLVHITNSSAYEPGTHQNISDIAAQNVLPNLLTDWGLGAYNDETQQFSDSQYDDKHTQCVYLGPSKFNNIDCKGDPNAFYGAATDTVQGLIRTGAALEDEDQRSLCHFFDPLDTNNATGSLHFFGDANFNASDWALTASSSDYCWLLTVRSDTAQQYSLPSTTSDFYYALSANAQSDRSQQWGNLFLALGHNMHLLQDMAQPQHVRNDMHCDDPRCRYIYQYHPSMYEQFVYEHPFAYSSASQDFQKSQDFWHNASGSGLADFTNANFVSVGTLDGFSGLNAKPKYQFPQWDQHVIPLGLDDAYAYKQMVGVPPQVGTQCTTASPCVVDEFESSGPSLVNQYAVSEGLFDNDLATGKYDRLFTLNDINYQAAENILVPEAVGYSAGLLNYVFRGRLGVDLDTEIAGNYVIANLSNYAFSNGTLEVYYDSTDSNGNVDRYKITGVTTADGLDLSNLSLDAANCSGSCNNSVSISIPPAQTPTPDSPGLYMFVFKGTIGTEPGVAGYSFTSKHGPSLMLNWANNNADRSTTPTRLYNFDASGNLENNDFTVGDGSGFLTLQIAEYHGDAISTNGFNVYTGVGTGVGTLYPSPPCGSDARKVGGVTVNDSGIYVVTEYYGCVGDPNRLTSSFDHFGFDGKLIASIPIAETVDYDEYGDNYSANDTEICSGNTIMNLDWTVKMTLPLQADGDVPADCAVTSNRIYVLAGNDTSGADYILVFDNDGNKVGIIPNVPGETMAATDSDIYLSERNLLETETTHVIYDYVRKVIRNPNNTIQSETFTRRSPDIQLTGHTGLSQAVVVDMLYVLDGPTQ